MIAQELEVSLHMAFVEARQKQHEFITVEHLLLAMLDNPSAADVLRACGAKGWEASELRRVAQNATKTAGVTHAIDRDRTGHYCDKLFGGKGGN